MFFNNIQSSAAAIKTIKALKKQGVKATLKFSKGKYQAAVVNPKKKSVPVFKEVRTPSGVIKVPVTKTIKLPFGITKEVPVTKKVSSIGTKTVKVGSKTFNVSVFPKEFVTPAPPADAFVTESKEKFNAFKDAGIRQVTKKTVPDFERAAKNFIADEPEILFTSEYVIDDQFCGALLVWETYRDATHYEVYKRNAFKSDSKFERVCFLSVADLDEERSRLFPYVRDTLGFTQVQEDDVYCFLDHAIKEDRIYEYRIRAARVPQDASEVDFDMILESKDLLNITTIGDKSDITIFDLASQSFGSEDLAWVLALVNEEGFEFFGRRPAELPLVDFIAATVGGKNSEDEKSFVAYTPKNISDVTSLIQESISLFGAKETVERLINVLGGLPTEFKDVFINSVDDTRNVFSYDNFREEISKKVPVIDLVFDIAESKDEGANKKLSKLNIRVPTRQGSAILTSVTGVTQTLKFVNEIALALLYSQGEKTFEKLQSIYDDIDSSKTSGDDSLSDAMKSLVEDVVKRNTPVSNSFASFLNIVAGKATTKKQSKSVQNKNAGFLLKGFRQK